MKIVRRGTERARASAASVLAHVRAAFALDAAIGGPPDKTDFNL